MKAAHHVCVCHRLRLRVRVRGRIRGRVRARVRVRVRVRVRDSCGTRRTLWRPTGGSEQVE